MPINRPDGRHWCAPERELIPDDRKWQCPDCHQVWINEETESGSTWSKEEDN